MGGRGSSSASASAGKSLKRGSGKVADAVKIPERLEASGGAKKALGMQKIVEPMIKGVNNGWYGTRIRGINTLLTKPHASTLVDNDVHKKTVKLKEG